MSLRSQVLRNVARVMARGSGRKSDAEWQATLERVAQGGDLRLEIDDNDIVTVFLDDEQLCRLPRLSLTAPDNPTAN